MARAPKATGTAVANYDEELAALATKGATLATNTGGGKFFSTQSGVLSYDDAPLPGNQMAVIIGAWCLENVFYEGVFDKDNRTPPTCFAFCKDPDEIDEMGPPDIVDTEGVFTRQSVTCKECPQNEWGSADTGRGKACSNRRRLALLPAGIYKPLGRTGGHELDMEGFDAEHFANAEAAYLKLPVMSGKGFDTYVKDLLTMFNKPKPTFAVYTRIFLTPDPKSQFRVNFELLGEVEDNAILGTLLARHKKLYEDIDFPYTPFEAEEEAKPARKASGKLTKPAARGKR